MAQQGAINEGETRSAVADALRTVRPIVTMSREGLVITALDWAAAGEAT
jgi:hypothetical protein